MWNHLKYIIIQYNLRMHLGFKIKHGQEKVRLLVYGFLGYRVFHIFGLETYFTGQRIKAERG